MGKAGPYGDLVAQERDGAPRYHHFDALGSTRALSDALQVVTDEYAYGAWGEPLAATGSSPNPYRWVGELGYRYDATNATYNLRAREYQDKIARFLSRDPIREPNGEPNRYRYADGSPLDVADPSGEQPPIITYDPRTDTWSPPVTVVIVIGNQVEVIIDGQHYIYESDAPQAIGRLTYSNPRPGTFPPALVRRAREDQSAVNRAVIELLAGAAFGLALRVVGRLLGLLRRGRPSTAKPTPGLGTGAGRGAIAEETRPPATLGPPKPRTKPEAPPPSIDRGTPHPSTPVGRKRSPLGHVEPNAPTTIAGRDYTGHAIDSMQRRGIPPSAVENTIKHGVPGRPQPVGGTTTSHYDPINNITVITDTATGRVVTVHYGK